MPDPKGSKLWRREDMIAATAAMQTGNMSARDAATKGNIPTSSLANKTSNTDGKNSRPEMTLTVDAMPDPKERKWCRVQDMVAATAAMQTANMSVRGFPGKGNIPTSSLAEKTSDRVGDCKISRPEVTFTMKQMPGPKERKQLRVEDMVAATAAMQSGNMSVRDTTAEGNIPTSSLADRTSDRFSHGKSGRSEIILTVEQMPGPKERKRCRIEDMVAATAAMQTENMSVRDAAAKGDIPTSSLAERTSDTVCHGTTSMPDMTLTVQEMPDPKGNKLWRVEDIEAATAAMQTVNTSVRDAAAKGNIPTSSLANRTSDPVTHSKNSGPETTFAIEQMPGFMERKWCSVEDMVAASAAMQTGNTSVRDAVAKGSIPTSSLPERTSDTVSHLKTGRPETVSRVEETPGPKERIQWRLEDIIALMAPVPPVQTANMSLRDDAAKCKIPMASLADRTSDQVSHGTTSKPETISTMKERQMEKTPALKDGEEMANMSLRVAAAKFKIPESSLAYGMGVSHGNNDRPETNLMVKEMPHTKKRKQWRQDDMIAAISAVQTGKMSLGVAATKFNIPKSTLADRINRQVSHSETSKPETIPTVKEMPGPRERKLWLEEDMIAAVDAVQRGKMSLGIAAAKFNIPKSTLADRKNRQVSYGKTSRPEAILTDEKPGPKERKPWLEEDMIAVAAVQTGNMSLGVAAAKFNIPESTLADRKNRRFSHGETSRPETISAEEMPGPKERKPCFEEDMIAAVAAVQTGNMSLGVTAAKFDIPKSTLPDRKNRQFSHGETGKPETISTVGEMPGPKERKLWLEENMIAAVDAVLTGKMSLGVAAATFNIPKSTLADRKNRQVNRGKTSRTETISTEAEMPSPEQDDSSS